MSKLWYLARGCLRRKVQILQCCYRHGHFSHAESNRHVSTMSSLGIAFNSKTQEKLNLDRLMQDSVGLLAIPELKNSQGFYLLQENAVQETEDLVHEACLSVESGQRSRLVVKVFDQLSDCLCKVADMAEFVRIAHPDSRFASAADNACMTISVLVEKLNTNTEIYTALQHVLTHGDVTALDDIDTRVAKLFLFDFEQSGIHLSGNKRQLFVKLTERCMQLSSMFMQGCQQSVTAKKSQLPERLRPMFNGDEISVSGLLSNSHNDALREAAYRLYLHPDTKQEKILTELLTTRHEIAQLAGFQSHAHRVLQGTIADNPDNVNTFLDNLAAGIKDQADEDFSIIREAKKLMNRQSGISAHAIQLDDVFPWDVAYYGGVIRQQRCQIDHTSLAPYLSLGSCMEGLGGLLEQLYGVRLEYQKAGWGELWSDDVHKLAVVHETEGVLGYIYCDFYERTGKPHQDCHFTIRVGRELEDGSYQNPVVVVMLNLPRPYGTTPSLLTPSMMENLFHEFGHAMHSMLGRTRYQHVAGTRCATDFAEVPSVLMEYFATDARVLSTFCHHWKTGEPLPEEQIHQLQTARNLFSASEMQLQVFYSMLDQRLHQPNLLHDARTAADATTCDILAEVQNQYYSIPHFPNTALHLRFGHTVGYGAKYYSYLMSRAIASRIWQKCFKDDPFSRQMGEKYRRTVLAHGGQKHPNELIEDLLHEKPTVDVFVQSLIEDIKPS